VRFRSPFLVLPLIALALGFLFSTTRAPEEQPLTLDPSGLPPRVAFTALLVDARDPRHLLLGSDDGVFFSRTTAREWSRSGLDGVRIDGLAQVGGAIYASSGDRVWRLGETWKRVQIRPEPFAYDHAPDPNVRGRALTAGRMLRLSTDSTRTWTTVLEASGGVPAVAWSPSEPGVAYAVGGDAQLYRSDDGGETWLVAG
jgi:hypothetical protein